ncbi:hypothetical protein M3Y97_00060600 [Aphelenchoides bicaudatus]|nr:hypothetical protein M3Y97_00060600 [Aphelenchoides bicaudatus]
MSAAELEALTDKLGDLAKAKVVHLQAHDPDYLEKPRQRKNEQARKADHKRQNDPNNSETDERIPSKVQSFVVDNAPPHVKNSCNACGVKFKPGMLRIKFCNKHYHVDCLTNAEDFELYRKPIDEWQKVDLLTREQKALFN